jgi:hypothetical protein
VKKLWSEIKYWVVILIVFAVLFELVASMILFRKYTPARFASLHIISNLFSKGSVTQYTYEPWLMFRVSDYHADNINITGFERGSNPATFIKYGTSDTVDIFFFGGNTMFGENLPDSQTIPSRFVAAYRNQNPQVSIRVKNFGIPHYYSKQELMLLTSLLFEGDRPDIVIFLDGLNDFYPARMLYYDKPYFSYALQQSFEGKMLQKGNESFIDSTVELHNDPPGVSSTDYNNALISKYMKNIRMAAGLCKSVGVKSYFFCEPVPAGLKRFEYIYPQLEKNKDSIPNFYYLGRLNQNADVIAKHMLTIVKNDLR